MIEQLRIIIKKSLHLKMIHCCEAPRSRLSSYFCKKQVLRGTLEKIWRIQIQMYPKKYVEVKYGERYFKNKVIAHRLGSVFQLSWWVAPPCNKSEFATIERKMYFTQSMGKMRLPHISRSNNYVNNNKFSSSYVTFFLYKLVYLVFGGLSMGPTPSSLV